MMGTFIAILLIFLSANITGIVFTYNLSDGEVPFLKEQLKRSIKEDLDIGVWDQFQKTFECCGVDSYEDWKPRETPESCQYQSSVSTYTYTNGCFDLIEMPYRIVFWAIPSLMTLVLISSCYVCLRNKANSQRRYQSDDEATINIELQQLHYPNPSAPSFSEIRQPLIQNNPSLYPKLADAPPSYHDVNY